MLGGPSWYESGTSRHARVGTIASRCRTLGVATEGPSARACTAIRTLPSSAVGDALTVPVRRSIPHSFAAARHVDVAIWCATTSRTSKWSAA